MSGAGLPGSFAVQIAKTLGAEATAVDWAEELDFGRDSTEDASGISAVAVRRCSG